MNNLQAYYSGRTQSQSSYDGPQEQEPERRATGPIPKVCRLRNLGGGGYDFGSSFGAATLPRHGGGRRLSVTILAFVPKVHKLHEISCLFHIDVQLTIDACHSLTFYDVSI